MFGNDTADRFLVMLTFCDHTEPLAKEGILKANFKIKEFFKINNGAIFSNLKSDASDN
jgi:hypothetical protein